MFYSQGGGEFTGFPSPNMFHLLCHWQLKISLRQMRRLFRGELSAR